jgi:membrane protein
VGHALGIGSAAVTVWDIAKWPVLLIIVSIMFAVLYWASPRRACSSRWAWRRLQSGPAGAAGGG